MKTCSRLALLLLLGVVRAQSGQECGTDPQAPYCTDDETCCMDSPGCTGVCSECCLNVVDACVLPRPGFVASTCCPKWSVGCSTGTVGCCDPARPWSPSKPTNNLLTTTKPIRQPNRLRAMEPKAQPLVEEAADESPSSGGPQAYALFTRAILPGLVAFTIDVASGKTTHHPVTGAFDNYMQEYYGEGTRLLEWDPKSARFVHADVDLAGGKGNASSPVVLYTIDPVDGTSTSAPVSGCSGYPMGIAWDAGLNKLIIATQTSSTISYFGVDAATAVATPMGTLARGASESASSSFYAAYISHAHGGVAVRVGHELVTKGTQLGVGTVTLGEQAAHAPPAASWSPLDLGVHDLPATVHSTAAAVDVVGSAPRVGSYVSLAPKKGAPKIEYDIVSWSAGGTPKILATLNNSHPPYNPLVGPLGYVGASLAGSRYGAMTVALHPNPLLPGWSDKWTLATIDLSAPEPSTTLVDVALDPAPSFEGAETVSLSGFGLAA